MGEPVIGILASIFGLLIGLCVSGRDFARIVQSKKRMQDADYLRQLLQIQEISMDEYEKFCSEIK